MKFFRPPSDARRSTAAPRAAFTLIELLVAVSILVLLATLAVGAFNVNSNDQATAASNQIKTMMDGAKSRAVRSGKVVGLRLVADVNDPRIATSLTYVGAPDLVQGTCDLTHLGGAWLLTDDAATWMGLKASGLLNLKCRIEVPAMSGMWYALSAVPAGNNALAIAGHYQPSQFAAGVFTAVPADNVPYRLELAPAPLAEDPVALPRQTCIDLDGSSLPSNWRPGLGTSYSPTMDILFTPDGKITGEALNAGVLHFHVAYVPDVVLAVATPLTGRPVNTGSTGVVQADPERPHRAISLFTNTGAIVISEINPTGDNTDGISNNAVATDPYKFAVQGKDN